MIAPRRAIGLPCADSSVTLGGATGRSERDSGAVIASHSTSAAKTTSPHDTIRRRVSQRGHQRRRAGGTSTGGAAGGTIVRSQGASGGGTSTAEPLCGDKGGKRSIEPVLDE
jgi:hypothetical protein